MEDTGKSGKITEETKLSYAVSILLVGYLSLLISIGALFLGFVTARQLLTISAVIAIVILVLFSVVSLIKVEEKEKDADT